ncbi:BRO family protein [Sutterella wadsworthensis]|jgi:prophage antirepressor-like protein|uniref:BRO family protein n=1 Tax=Sutterella wadsworthensis TaxID=40545 RepID=UPI0026DD1277|nr:BRO family protein [Sutterella wadsworthensis]
MSIIAFSFENTSVRTLGTPEAPLFVAIDICKALSHSNPRKAIADLVDPEDIVKAEIDTAGGKQTVNCVTESGLYALIFGSKLESAKRFKRWVTSEVLPAIRKQGYYAGPAYIDEAQQREIQRAVGRRAAGIGKNFRVIYSALKDHFRIPRYTCLQKKDFEAALAFIQTVPVKTRAEWVKHEEEEIKRIEAATYHDEPIPPKYYTVKAHFMEELRSLVYTWRYLHRANLERYVDFLRSVDSPYAASMWEAVHDFNWLNLESSLDKIGYSVKELPCYKHWLSHQPA